MPSWHYFPMVGLAMVCASVLLLLQSGAAPAAENADEEGGDGAIEAPAVGLAAAPAVALPGADLAVAPSCPTHVVQRGETLNIIAGRQLGNAEQADLIYRANRQAIGDNPNLIEPGMRLTIPCSGDNRNGPAAANRITGTADARAGSPQPADGGQIAPVDTSASAAAAERLTAAGTPGSAAGLSALARRPQDVDPLLAPRLAATNAARSAARAADEPPQEIFVLTGAPYLPFVDPGDDGGGMLTELILAAFAETEGPPLRIGFVNDRSAHLDIILPRGGFAFSFPWLLPDCTSGALTRQQAALCTRFVASDSLYEHVTEFYARADSPFGNARRPGDLAGARICRPAGYPVDDLVLAGLVPDRAELVRRNSPRGCLVALDGGQVDVASLDAALARVIVTQLSPENPILVLEGLTRIERLHAVTPRGDTAGEAAIDRLNAGLAILVETGLWYQIVNRHLRGS